MTAHLASLGLSVFGLDLSESMLAIARRENPELRFEQGSMLELDLPDGSLAGAVSWYSSIHTPVDGLPDLFAEFHRVLAPGGHLLVAFQVGDEPRHHDRPWGHPVSLSFQRRRPEDIAELLTEAGFALVARTVREPDEVFAEPTPQAFLIARKPERSPSRSPGRAPAEPSKGARQIERRDVPEGHRRADRRARARVAVAHHGGAGVPGGVQAGDDGAVGAQDAGAGVGAQAALGPQVAGDDAEGVVGGQPQGGQAGVGEDGGSV